MKGSFTGAYRDKPGKLQLAHRGTLFLDEVGEMSLRMQALLLRFLENGEIQAVGADHIKSTVDVRVVAATNRNLGDMVANGQFREDLLYRLRVIHIHVPPLRERKEDVRVLVQHLAAEERGARGGVLRRGAAHARALSLAGQRPRAAERRRAGAVDVQRQRRGSGAPAGRRCRRPSTWCCPSRSAASRWPTSCTARWSTAATTSGSTCTRCSCSATSRGTTCASWCGAGLTTTRGNYRSLLRLFGLPAADYKRFLNFLAAHDCNVDFRAFRAGTAPTGPMRAPRLLPPLVGHTPVFADEISPEN